MLDQAIVDAKALKEAAIKNAESSIIEKYSQEIREAVDTMLNHEEVINEEEGGMVSDIPMAASDVSDAPETGGEEVVELDFQELEQMIDQELEAEGELDAAEMTDRHELADELEDEEESLQESDEIDLTSLFEYEDEVIDTNVETIDDNVQEDGYIQKLSLVGIGTTATAITSLSDGAVQKISITNDGFLSAENDSVPITGGGTGSIIQVNAIGNGGITDFIIDDAGNSFEIGDDLVFNNANFEITSLNVEYELSEYDHGGQPSTVVRSK